MLRASLLDALLLTALGCATPVHTLRPVLGLADLTGQNIEIPANTYRLTEARPSYGRFPCAIAVARLSWQDELPDRSDRSLVLEPLRDDEAARWNQLFDNISAVTETFPVSPTYLAEQPTTAQAVVASAAAVHAGLCIVFSQGETADNAASAVAAIYEAPSGRLLGVANAQVASDLPPSQQNRSSGSARQAAASSARQQAIRQLQDLIHQIVWQLVQLDRPAPATQPSPWSAWPGRGRLSY